MLLDLLVVLIGTICLNQYHTLYVCEAISSTLEAYTSPVGPSPHVLMPDDYVSYPYAPSEAATANRELRFSIYR